jgi:hypothetical protein
MAQMTKGMQVSGGYYLEGIGETASGNRQCHLPPECGYRAMGADHCTPGLGKPSLRTGLPAGRNRTCCSPRFTGVLGQVLPLFRRVVHELACHRPRRRWHKLSIPRFRQQAARAHRTCGTRSGCLSPPHPYGRCKTSPAGTKIEEPVAGSRTLRVPIQNRTGTRSASRTTAHGSPILVGNPALRPPA